MKFKNIKTENIIVADQTFINNLLDSADWVLIEEIETLPTLEEQKQTKIKQLQDKYQAEYNAYLAQYPQSEVATFDDKKSEALAYNLDNTTPTPIIDSIVAGYGDTITKEDYIQSVLDKVHYLAQKEGAMVKVRDRIKACTTQAELDAIVI